MVHVRKTFFDPLLTSKAAIRQLLETLPIGSAHPCSPEKLLLCRTENGIQEFDTSSYSEDYFFNAVDFGDTEDTLLARMSNFPSQLGVFGDFRIVRVSAPVFKIPLIPSQISIFMISLKKADYYDFCLADAQGNTSCSRAPTTFPGLKHSGDCLQNNVLLQHVRPDIPSSVTESELCVFISGYRKAPLARLFGTRPVLLVADHQEKILYDIPVPLDAATVEDATLWCPMVMKRDGNSLTCCVLPKATTDRGKWCNNSSLKSACFAEAINSAKLEHSRLHSTDARGEHQNIKSNDAISITKPSIFSNMGLQSWLRNQSRKISPKKHAVLTTNASNLPSSLNLDKIQIITFDTGLNFRLDNRDPKKATSKSAAVLPCIFGSRLEGPLLLATGHVPSNVPFSTENELLRYYASLKSLVVFVDERMTDQARTLAPSRRLNALFVVQLQPKKEPKHPNALVALLNLANINAVTALAGPQSLVLVQLFDKYYFYRGLANRANLDTSTLAFGADVTKAVESAGLHSLAETRVERFVDLDEDNTIIFQSSGKRMLPKELASLLQEAPLNDILNMKEDLSAAIPQLKVLMNQKNMQTMSALLVATLRVKVSDAMAFERTAYLSLIRKEYRRGNQESATEKAAMLEELRQRSKDLERRLEPVISSFANMTSSQTTSKRAYELKDHGKIIQDDARVGNDITFDDLAEYLERYARDVGVMLSNIVTEPYLESLRNLSLDTFAAISCCELDPSLLYLDGFAAAIIIPQAQNDHQGPLASMEGPLFPTLALPRLNEKEGKSGSALGWVCWDEFIHLESPFAVNWWEKRNEAHITAVRNITRNTLSRAVCSGDFKVRPKGPEISNLMSTLLVAAMSKLSMTRIAPTDSSETEDLRAKLMRGLFGNFLTMAISKEQAMGMVWQLFSLHTKCHLPASAAEWVWYEKVVSLYPFTGWSVDQFHANLEKLMNKAIIYTVSKNIIARQSTANHLKRVDKNCRLRDVQLQHSRTIIIVLMRTFSAHTIDTAAVASRLLRYIPLKLEKQSHSYTLMIKYLKHLASGGQRRSQDDQVIANVHTKRSAAFAEVKTKIAAACLLEDWSKVKEACEELLVEHSRLAALWNIEPDMLHVQNLNWYKGLAGADTSEPVSQHLRTKGIQMDKKGIRDAELNRRPWRVNNPGEDDECSDLSKPLDEEFVHEILTGELRGLSEQKRGDAVLHLTNLPVKLSVEEEFSEMESFVQHGFIMKMQGNLSDEDVCEILHIPLSSLQVFANALDPAFTWEASRQTLGKRFKAVALDLLRHGFDRAESRPARTFFGMGSDKTLQIEE